MYTILSRVSIRKIAFFESRCGTREVGREAHSVVCNGRIGIIHEKQERGTYASCCAKFIGLARDAQPPARLARVECFMDVRCSFSEFSISFRSF